ncbi:hypothetical protein [Castellaniella ginsengisoli]|uniref:Uncharacterized protein n=1 Tax=Castellaniella ginsengisoli TaxID=546114 RepID=A0AB39CJN5_9BURK
MDNLFVAAQAIVLRLQMCGVAVRLTERRPLCKGETNWCVQILQAAAQGSQVDYQLLPAIITKKGMPNNALHIDLAPNPVSTRSGSLEVDDFRVIECLLDQINGDIISTK